MNQYQREVEELDRAQRMKMRAVSFVGAATVVAVALWSAGAPSMEWLVRIQSWFEQQGEKPESASIAPAPASVSSPPAIPAQVASPHSLSGTTSSTSVTPQPLILVSASPGRNQFEGTANIGTNPNNPQTFAAGALLLNGASLVEIHKTYVVLQRGDKQARLNLVGPEGAPSGIGNELLAVGGKDEAASKPLAPSYEVFTDYIRPSPVYDGEMLRGYEVYGGKSSWVFSQMGLQAGDVVIALNDMPLNDPVQAMDLFRQIARGTAMTATVERKGKRERISLDGSLIAADQERQHEQVLSQAAPPMPAA